MTAQARAHRSLPAILMLVLWFANLPAALAADGYPPPPGSYRSLDQPAPVFSAPARPQGVVPDTATPGKAAAAQRQPFAANKLFGAPMPTPPGTAGTPRQRDFSMDFRKPARPPTGQVGRHPPDPASRAAWPPPRDGGRSRYPTAPVQAPVQAPGAAATMRPPARGAGGASRFSADMPGSPATRRQEVQPGRNAGSAGRRPEVFRPAG